MTRDIVTAGPDPDHLVREREAVLVLDVDEVVLEFITPFEQLLHEHGARLHPESFHLTGNVRSLSTGAAVSGGELDRITMLLYEQQTTRQAAVEGVVEALKRLETHADIVFLTAMLPAFYEQRRKLLDEIGLPYPLIATQRSKGSVVAELSRLWPGPVVFVDDLPPNLESVRRSAPRTRLIHLMANDAFRPHLPPLPVGSLSVLDWKEAEPLILSMLFPR